MKTSNYYYNRVKRAATKKNIKEFLFQVFMIGALVFMFVMAVKLYVV